MQYQLGYFRREKQTIRNYQIEVLEMKNKVMEIKSTFDRLISRLGRAKLSWFAKAALPEYHGSGDFDNIIFLINWQSRGVGRVGFF